MVREGIKDREIEMIRRWVIDLGRFSAKRKKKEEASNGTVRPILQGCSEPQTTYPSMCFSFASEFHTGHDHQEWTNFTPHLTIAEDRKLKLNFARFIETH